MAYILSIESASTNCSVAISEDGKNISVKELNAANYSHAENIHDFIQQVVNEANLDLNQLHAVSVSKGPGSYTGLRIGVSAAKGLAFGIGVPLVSIRTLEALARQIKTESGVIIPMLDARRMEAYTQVFSAKHQHLSAVEATILQEDSFENYLIENQVHFIGSGATKFGEICSHSNAHFHPNLVPSAKEQAELAFHKFQQGDFEDTAYFEPFYLKDFVAGKPKK